MKLTFLGTGDAFSNEGRNNVSILIESFELDLRILFDCSPQCVPSLRKLGFKISDLDYVFITHIHGDHVAGLPFMALSLIYPEIGGRFSVLGPPGLEKFLKESYALFYGSGNPERVIDFLPLDAKLPIKMHHIDSRHSVPGLIYRLDLEGKSIVYTGDTSKVDLSDFSRRATILIHEASDETEDSTSGHSTLKQAAETARDAQVEKLFVVHMPRHDSEIIRSAKTTFENVYFPMDGEVVEL